MESDFDGAMVKRAQDGDRQVFDCLVEQYRKPLVRYCARFLGAGAEAEDAVQESLLRAWTYIGTFRGESTFGSWLYRIARHASMDALDKRGKIAVDLAECGDLIDPAPSVEQLAIWDAMLQAIDAAAREHHWDPLDHTIFGLIFGLGKSQQEVSRLLNIPASTVRARFLRHIRPVLEQISVAFESG